MLENVHITHHGQKGQQRENDEELHGAGVHLLAVLVLLLAEDEGLVGVAEGLRYHGHNHGNLDAGAVDAQLGVGTLAVEGGGHVGIDDFVGRLVEDAGYA